ncbi:MAG: malate synthase [Proteobacteria bacterium]|nr:MAG: malate synthase [Pseudomonadota bacterium]
MSLNIEGLEIHQTTPAIYLERVLTAPALQFIKSLHEKFNPTRLELLKRRSERQKRLDEGGTLDFLAETKHIRDSEWKVAETPKDLLDRRVEITGPTEAKMLINALNSGAKVFMADLEDSLSPSWNNVVQGQINLQDAVRQTLSFKNDDGRAYHLKPGNELATLLVRPRGWHLSEKNVTLNGEAISASLFDFGLYFFHNVHERIKRGTAPYFYLPKMESHLEARLWNDVFNFSQDYLKVPRGTIRAMRSYAELLVKSCHKRGAHAIGGMAAFIPSRKDQEVNDQAIRKVTEDKQREVSIGFDGTWVAHPDLVPVAMKVFDAALGDSPNQKSKLRDDVKADAKALLNTNIEGSTITEEGVRHNIRVAIQYMNSWLNGLGAVALYNLMEDAATAEISRAQLWQWIRHKAKLADGRVVTADLYNQLRREELEALGGPQKDNNGKVVELLDKLVLSPEFGEFLTLPAYDLLQTARS